MNRKLLSIILCICLALTMIACGAKETGSVSTTSVSVSTETSTKTSTEAVTETSTEAVKEVEPETKTETSTETSAETTEEPTVEAEPEVAFADVVGVSSGKEYVNKYFAIGCTFDANWDLQSQEAIEENNKKAVELTSDDYKDIFETASTITDMYAVNVNQMDTINITIQKLDAEEAADITEVK